GDARRVLRRRDAEVDPESQVLEGSVDHVGVPGDPPVGAFDHEQDRMRHGEPFPDLLGRRLALAVERARELVDRRGDARGVAGSRRSDGEAQLASSAALAFSATALNPAGSLTAMSASTLRSSSISAFLQPATNWLYESPSCRAAALMRMIQSERIVRLRTLRSR